LKFYSKVLEAVPKTFRCRSPYSNRRSVLDFLTILIRAPPQMALHTFLLAMSRIRSSIRVALPDTNITRSSIIVDTIKIIGRGWIIWVYNIYRSVIITNIIQLSPIILYLHVHRTYRSSLYFSLANGDRKSKIIESNLYKLLPLSIAPNAYAHRKDGGHLGRLRELKS